MGRVFCTFALFGFLYASTASAAPKALDAEKISHACAAKTFRTLPSKKPQKAALAIENKSKFTLHLSWFTFKKGLKRYATIAPGKRHFQRTYVGHGWAVSVQSGKELVCFGLYRPSQRAVYRLVVTNTLVKGAFIMDQINKRKARASRASRASRARRR